jgi:hypothetical protein
MLLLFSVINRIGLLHVVTATLFKHVTNYDPRSGCLHYNLTTPIERAPISATWVRAEQRYGYLPWEPPQVATEHQFM